MAKEIATITFYKISQCGFYRFRDEEPLYGSISELMQQIKNWSSDKTFVETYLYEPKNDLLPVYLFDLTKAGSSWLLTMWNQVPSSNQSIASVMGNSQVGSAEVKMNTIEKGSIPGFATYFWVLPDKNIFATVRFQHLVTAQKAMQEYMESFWEMASSYAVLEYNQEENSLEHKGFSFDDPSDSQEVVPKLYPRFRTELVRRPGQHDLIRKNSDGISRVERRTTLKLSDADDRAWWQRLLKYTGIGVPNNKPSKMRLNYRLSTSVTQDDVTTIISNWESNPEKQWDDFGFVFRGSTDIHWLSSSLAREEVELEVERSNDEVVDAKSLLEALNGIRHELPELAE